MASCDRCFTLLPPGAFVCPNCGAPVRAPGPTAGPYSPTTAPSPSRPAGPPVAGAPAAAIVPPSRLPLLPGETVLRQYATDVARMRSLRTRQLGIVVGVVLVLTVPLLALAILGGGGANVGGLAIAFVPLVLIVGMLLAIMARARDVAPTYATVTNRRILVENLAGGASSASMPLDNLSDVVIAGGSAARGAGVAWVYLLPLGATTALVGGGRNRRAAPGVIWIPALPVAQAEELKRTVLPMARELQGRERAPPPPPPPP